MLDMLDQQKAGVFLQTFVSETGAASWYGKPYHGRETANGETYDMDALTAAHRYLPMNTQVRVVNLANGKSVIVRINDRGPFADGRIIDVSRRAALELGMLIKGTAKVRVEVLKDRENVANTAQAPRNPGADEATR
jgi:rare lipoprotein A